jgi:tRNA U34 5-methylaminomethyl-2-thiouridine-forming methyltransferase MnmC
MNPSDPVGHLPGLAPVTEPEQMGRPELIREVKRLTRGARGC